VNAAAAIPRGDAVLTATSCPAPIGFGAPAARVLLTSARAQGGGGEPCVRRAPKQPQLDAHVCVRDQCKHSEALLPPPREDTKIAYCSPAVSCRKARRKSSGVSMTPGSP
jgi:hypothetical protein